MVLDYSFGDGVAVITFDRPDVLNAFDDELGRAALHALTIARESDDVRCVVLTGAGRAFSSGEDLAALSDAYTSGEAPDLGRILAERYNPLIRAIRSAPKPVIAAVNGVAAGAGASIALACDVRIAAERAKLVLAFTKVALVPDSGSLWFLTSMVGSAVATRLARTGAPVSAAEALDLGLFDEVVHGDGFEARWRTVATELASGPTLAYALTKELVTRAQERSLEEQLDAEVGAQRRAGASSDHLEGVQAFLAKRPPRFEGR